MTHICVGKLAIIGSDNGLSPERRQAIIWTNDGILLIEPLRTNFSEILIEILTFSFKEMHLKMSSGKWRPFCLGLIVLNLRLQTSEYFIRTRPISWLSMPRHLSCHAINSYKIDCVISILLFFMGMNFCILWHFSIHKWCEVHTWYAFNNH